MDNKFNVYKGTFTCKTCKEDVYSARLWGATAELTWMCKNKHVTSVTMVPPKKKKKDFTV